MKPAVVTDVGELYTHLGDFWPLLIDMRTHCPSSSFVYSTVAANQETGDRGEDEEVDVLCS